MNKEVSKMFEGQKILITGGTGSIGQEILREILKYEPAVVRIRDVDETKQFELQQEYKDYEKNICYFLGDVRDKERLLRALEDIDIVFHTAALKHVLACEYNPFEAVKTNVIGIQNLIDVAMDVEAGKVIFTSSDKAVNPTNLMGATKLLAERLMTSANCYKGARNIGLLTGKPLIAWTIVQAKNSKYIDRIIVSTEDREITEISKDYGAEVPFLRPKELIER